jgi:hypothetical protein
MSCERHKKDRGILCQEEPLGYAWFLFGEGGELDAAGVSTSEQVRQAC